MAFYTVMIPPPGSGGARDEIERARLLPETFTWPAFIFGGLWLLELPHRFAGGERWTPGARVVAAWRLDLDHLGAHVGEDHAAGRPHHHVGEFEHTDSGERQVFCGASHGAGG